MLTTERAEDRARARAHAIPRLAGLDWIEALRAAAWPFIATRVAFILIGLAATSLFADHPTRVPPNPNGTGWMRWDAQWFIGLAEHGYSWTLNPHKSSAAFFPLYPFLTHLVSLGGIETGLAAMLVANVAFLLALCYLYRLARLDASATVASRSLWLLAVFPTAISFFIPYTESLYVLLAVATFWYLRRHCWLAAGVAGALCALTRQNGVVLFAPYLVEWGVVYGAAVLRRRDLGAALRALLPALLIPLAVGAHLAYLWSLKGSPTAFLRAQDAWNRRLEWPWAGLVATVQRWTLPSTATQQHVHMALEFSSVVVFLVLLALGVRRLRLSYTVYAALYWLTVLISPAIERGYPSPLMSSSRFALSVFPSFILLALLLRREGAFQTWLTASAMILGLLTAFFAVGGWVA